MPKLLPKEKAKQIKELVYSKADDYGFMTRGRVENGQFLSFLVEDSAVGGVLSGYIEKSNIRTYIKDAILNGYTKSRKREILKKNSAEDIINKLYSKTVNFKKSIRGVTICYSDDNRIFVVSSGTFLKWETALRKALELIVCEPQLFINGKNPEICLQIAIVNQGITDGDKKLIIDSLKAISVNVIFCGT